LLNGIFVGLIVISVLVAAFTGRMPEVMQASIDSAKAAITVAISLLGMMALWLGLMRVLRDAGFMSALARGLAPVMRRLFPDVPADHPAMGAMIMNMAANMLGLGNAATPFGLKAMQELERLNPHPGVATNSMALFLAINTSGVAVMPLGVIAVRAGLGSLDAAGIFVPTVLATLCSTVIGVSIAKLLQRRRRFAVERYTDQDELAAEQTLAEGIRGIDQAEEVAAIRGQPTPLRLLLCGAVLVALLAALVLHAAGSDQLGAWALTREVLSSWLLPVLMVVIVLAGFGWRVKVYDAMIQGAREGFDIFVMIIPFLVTILVAVGMFRASGALEWIAVQLQAVTSLPAEGLMMALVRPLSGSGALGVMTEAMTTHGPDSFTGYLVSVMSGSTETTFYVLALYFGSVQIRAARHTVLACLAADLTGFVAAVLWCRLFFAT
jgi:spore maturation protein SpmA